MADSSKKGSAVQNRATSSGRGGGKKPPASQMPTSVILQRNLQAVEPEEVRILRKFARIGATYIQTVYTLSGLSSRLIAIPIAGSSGFDLVELTVAESRLSEFVELQRRQIYLDRRSKRLPKDRHNVGWEDLTPEEKRILSLTQPKYNAEFPNDQ